MEFLTSFAQEYAALVVSICALVLTISQANATRRHNKLMIRPHLTSFTDQSPAPGMAGVTLIKMALSNNGIGPAVIKSYEPLLDGQPLDPTKGDELLAVAKQVLPAPVLDHPCEFAFFRKGYVMAKDEEKNVATVAVVITLDTDLMALRKAQERFHLRVQYESLYGEQFVYDSRDHF